MQGAPPHGQTTGGRMRINSFLMSQVLNLEQTALADETTFQTRLNLTGAKIFFLLFVKRWEEKNDV